MKRILMVVLLMGVVFICETISFAIPVDPAVETFNVSATSYADVSSSMVLTEGETYYILAEGTYVHGFAGYICDAEWGEQGVEAALAEEPSQGAAEHDLLINDIEYDWLGLADVITPDPISFYGDFDVHTYSPSHKYWLAFTGEGGAIRFSIQDGVYGDNSGELTVSIYTPEPGTILLVGFGGLALLRKRRA